MRTILIIFFIYFTTLVKSQTEVKLSLVDPEELILQFTVSNPSEEPIKILKRGTPLEGVWSDMFDIRDNNNQKVFYVGKIVRRGPFPTEDEYITILSGGSVSVPVNLSENYHFFQPGVYQVRLDLPLYSELHYKSSDAQVLKIDFSRNISTGYIPSLKGFTNCNSPNINQINAAIAGSITATSRAYSCLRQRSCEAEAINWFGTYSVSNRDFDISCFLNVNNRLNNYDFSAYCNPPGCGSNVYGYVYPTDSTYTVYLCGLFWSIPNERINTIVHEMSHFRTLGGTGDYTYGKTNCQNLAISDPFRASRNADNVCYFSEVV